MDYIIDRDPGDENDFNAYDYTGWYDEEDEDDEDEDDDYGALVTNKPYPKSPNNSAKITREEEFAIY